MAKRPTQNTEALEDSLQGGAPAEAEGANQTGEADTAPVIDPASAALAAAVQALGDAPGPILPDPTPVEFVERRLATTASAIELDGHRFGLDDPIPLTAAQFDQMKGTGALVESAWDDLTPL